MPGDVVEIKTGETIPADLVLISTFEMKVNNVSITGEDEQLYRYAEDRYGNIFETPNVAFSGT